MNGTAGTARDYRRERSSAMETLREVVRGLRMMAGGRGVDELYDLLSTHNNLGERSLYLNMGYWREARTYDDACEALAVLLAESAHITPGDRVFDAGYGFGDQDILWAERYGAHVIGYNITASQARVAAERAARSSAAERIDLRYGSALATDLEDGSMDVATALESAFHFPGRERFFREAHRVLRPGGRMAIADIVPTRRPSSRLVDRVGRHLARSFWQIPDDNWYPLADYVSRIEDAGFVDVEASVITDDVFRPFGDYARVRQGDRDVVRRANPLMRAVWRAPSATGVFDYVVISARKEAER